MIKQKLEQFKDWFVFKFQNPYRLERPYGYCPVQIMGTLESGDTYYFRARGSRWSLTIAPTEKELFDVNTKLFDYSENYGKTFEAGWMKRRDAIRFATFAIRKWRMENEPKSSCNCGCNKSA